MWLTSTSYMLFSTLSGSMPWLIVRLPCGSRSMAEHAVAGLGEGDGQVEGRGRLRDAALLVGEGDDLGRARLVADAGARPPAAAGPARRRERLLGAHAPSSSSSGSESVTGAPARLAGAGVDGAPPGSGFGSPRVGLGPIRAAASSARGRAPSRSTAGGASAAGSVGARSASAARRLAWASRRWSTAGRPSVELSGLDLRLKSPIDRAYSHASVRFPAMDPPRGFAMAAAPADVGNC